VILPDVNVLIYAFRRDSERHDEYREWVQEMVDGPHAYGMAPQVLASVVRITTHRRAYTNPALLEDALAFCEALLDPPHATVVQPGERHWQIYRDLCAASRAPGSLTQDAWFAALAIEHGCEWISADAHYARFPGLRWRRPFE
jgi:toxin-antitoxin system PIN domain toxin